MSEIQRSLFDYSSLASEVVSLVRNEVEVIRGWGRIGGQAVFEIGQSLSKIKETVKHGQFLAIIEAEFGFSDQTARNFMTVFQRLPKSQTVLDFSPKALYLLAAPSTPEPAIQTILAKAESGEKTDIKTVKAEIKKAKAEAAAAKKAAQEADAARIQATRAYSSALAEKDKLAEELKTRPVIEKTVEKVVEKTVAVIPDGYSDEKAALEALKKKKDQAQREVSETYERKQRIQAELIELEERRRRYSDSEKEAKQHEAVLQELSRVLVHMKPDFDLFEEPPVPQMRNKWLDCATSLRIFADDIERWCDRDDARVIDIHQIEGAA